MTDSSGLSFSAVIFDMDGLILDSEPIARRAWERAMGDWGRVIPWTVYREIIGRTRTDMQALFLSTLGRDLPIEAITERKDLYLEEIIGQEGVPVKPGLHELLDMLVQRGIPRAVASSTEGDAARARLSLAGVAHRFDAVLGGEEASRGKPAPDLFLAASARIGVPAGRCIVLEDSGAGIMAAHAAGMIPIMVPDLIPPTEGIRHLAHRIFPSLHQVYAYLAASCGLSDGTMPSGNPRT